MDKLDAQRRSENMRRIRSKNTKPEVLLRSLLHRQGYRFRIHRKDLPGKPDLVFAGRRKAIFVHGCFWHQHPGCREGRLPGTRQEYWQPKLGRNIERDAHHSQQLNELGWDVLIIWECELAAQLPNSLWCKWPFSTAAGARLRWTDFGPKMRDRRQDRTGRRSGARKG